MRRSKSPGVTPLNKGSVKTSFLENYRRHRHPGRACFFVGISREELETLAAEDDEFRLSIECVAKDITDDCNQLLMKYAGIVPWTENDKKRGLDKAQDKHVRIRSIALILSNQNAGRRTAESPTVNNVLNLTINGIGSDDLSNLIGKQQEAIEAETEADDNPSGQDQAVQ